MDDNQTLSDYAAGEIRATLARRQITGKELASKLGVSRSWISYRLTGTTEIGLNDLQRIAAALSVDIADLLPTNAPVGKPRGGSVHLTSQPATHTRTDQVRPGHATPTLTHPPISTPIRPASEQPATTGRNRRPVRLSGASTGGGSQ